MDPSLATTYPSAILCRDKALVVNLEHIKVIITTNCVLVMNPEDENVLPFISELKNKITQPSLGGLGASPSYPAVLSDLAAIGGGGMQGGGLGGGGGGDSQGGGKSAVNLAKLENLQGLQMPFELKALEVCLDSVGLFLGPFGGQGCGFEGGLGRGAALVVSLLF